MKSKIKTFFIAIVAACSALCLTQTTFAVFGKTSEIIQNNEVQICSLTEELNELKKDEQSLPESIEKIKRQIKIIRLEQTIDELRTKNNIINYLQCIDHEIKNLKDKIENKNIENKTIKTLLEDIKSNMTSSIEFINSINLIFSINLSNSIYSFFDCFFKEISSIKSTNNTLKENIENETKIDEENKKNFLQHIEAIFNNIKNIKEICSKYQERYYQYIENILKNMAQTENINDIQEDEKQTENISNIKDDEKQNKK